MAEHVGAMPPPHYTEELRKAQRQAAAADRSLARLRNLHTKLQAKVCEAGVVV